MPFLAFWGTEFYRIPKIVKYVEDMIFEVKWMGKGTFETQI